MTNRSQHETEADHSADDEQADKAAALADASPVVIFLVVIAMEGGLFLLALLLGFAFDTPPLARLSPATWPLVGWGVGAALIPALVVILLLRTRVGFALRLLAKARSAMEPLLRLQLWQLALIALTTGLIEEALFRGVLQTAITNVLAVHTDAPMAHVLGVLSGALLFGCAHPASRAKPAP